MLHTISTLEEANNKIHVRGRAPKTTYVLKLITTHVLLQDVRGRAPKTKYVLKLITTRVLLQDVRGRAPSRGSWRESRTRRRRGSRTNAESQR